MSHDQATARVQQAVPEAARVSINSFTSFPDEETTWCVLVTGDDSEPFANVVGRPSLESAVLAAIAEAHSRKGAAS